MTPSTSKHEETAFSPVEATDEELDAAWFRPPPPPSRPSIRLLRPSAPPPPPMGDPLCDGWFR